MTRKKVTAVFDIGKTNKKFFLFDENFKEVFREYTRLPEITDEDNYPTEDLVGLQKWMRDTFDAILKNEEFETETLNFSSYGASFVHLDQHGKVLTPLYNYTKPISETLTDEFYKKYGGTLKVATETASPQCGFLNSGMQLYWLKKTQPEVFKKIKYSLHLPQFLSYLFAGIPVTEYTSIGCHTNLWDFQKKDYHEWVYAEGIDWVLPAIVPTSASINTTYRDKKIKIGVGIHDSSSALLPYILSKNEPFLLVSTGTMSIALNPFNEEQLTEEDIRNNCLNYSRIDGKRVKASRFLMGNEYRLQAEKLEHYYRKEAGYHKNTKFDKQLYLKLAQKPSVAFHFERISIKRKQPKETQLEQFNSFEVAYHQLMVELMQLQIEAINTTLGNSEIKKIYVDGGFTDNDVFMKLLSFHYKDFEVLSTESPLGSALGAAILISDKELDSDFLKKNYSLKKHHPFTLK